MISVSIAIVLSTLSANCQGIADTKKFIDNVFWSNPIYDKDFITQCQVWDNTDISSSDVNFYTNVQQSEDFISHFLMFKVTMKVTEKGVETKEYYFVDVRNIKDVGILQVTSDGQMMYSIIIDFKKDSKSYKYVKIDVQGESGETRGITGFSRAELVLPNNKEEALRVKRAILHLISLKGGNASDGDIF